MIRPEGEEGHDIPSNWGDILKLYTSGKGFFFGNDFYLLPRAAFTLNSFDYQSEDGEPLSIFVGYRGHAHPYRLILTPSVLRDAGKDYRTEYLAYKVREGYAGNLLREAYWHHEQRILQDLQARGILQHHKTIGNTDILDLSYEPDVAKLFALSEPTPAGYIAKSWQDEEDYSCVYKIVVRVMGGTPKPIELQPEHPPLSILPFNVCPLSAATEVAERDRGFGVWGFGMNDADNYGMVLNITEWRYHPQSAPHGWDPIGGPLFKSADAVRDMETNERRQLLGLPPEPSWLESVLGEVRTRVADRFRIVAPQEPII